MQICYFPFNPQRIGRIIPPQHHFGIVIVLMGIQDAVLCGKGIGELIIPIYYYKKGSESILHNIAGEFDQMGTINMGNALLFHYYTNMYSSFPEEDYLPLIRSMWDEMFESLIDKTDMNEKVNFALPKVGNVCCCGP